MQHRGKIDPIYMVLMTDKFKILEQNLSFDTKQGQSFDVEWDSIKENMGFVV